MYPAERGGTGVGRRERRGLRGSRISVQVAPGCLCNLGSAQRRRLQERPGHLADGRRGSGPAAVPTRGQQPIQHRRAGVRRVRPAVVCLASSLVRLVRTNACARRLREVKGGQHRVSLSPPPGRGRGELATVWGWAPGGVERADLISRQECLCSEAIAGARPPAPLGTAWPGLEAVCSTLAPRACSSEAAVRPSGRTRAGVRRR